MKNLPALSIIGLYLMMLLSSCDMLLPCGTSKDAFLENYNQLTDQASENGDDFTEAQWEASDERFRKMVEECYDQWEEEMSFREQRKFWGRSLKYYFQRHGNRVANELMDEDNSLSTKIREEMEAVWGDSDMVLNDLLKDLGGDEMNDLLKDIGKDIEKWGERLEEIFKK
ncbi:MAG: hypothetical protein AAFO94_10490 [Bacteroidota bacterium]